VINQRLQLPTVMLTISTGDWVQFPVESYQRQNGNLSTQLERDRWNMGVV